VTGHVVLEESGSVNHNTVRTGVKMISGFPHDRNTHTCHWKVSRSYVISQEDQNFIMNMNQNMCLSFVKWNY